MKQNIQQDWEVKPLSAQSEILAVISAEKISRMFIYEGLSRKKADAIANNVAICAYSLHDESGKRIFKSVWELLENLSLNQIAYYANMYKQINNRDKMDFEQAIESGYNSSFDENINNSKY